MKVPADLYFSMNYNFYQVIPYMFPTDVEDSIVFSVSTKTSPISIPFSNLGGMDKPHTERGKEGGKSIDKNQISSMSQLTGLSHPGQDFKGNQAFSLELYSQNWLGT